MAEVHAEATASGNRVHATTGDSRERKMLDGDQGPDAGPEGVQSDIEDRGAESAWRSSNGVAPLSGDRAASEGPQDNKAQTEVSAMVRGITTVAVLAVAVVAAVAYTITSGRSRSWRVRVGGRGSWRRQWTASSSPRRCRCSCGAEPGCRRERWPGRPCSLGSARVLPPTLPPLTPRRSGDLSPRGHQSLCCSLGSC